MHKLPINVVIVTVGLIRRLELKSQVESATFEIDQRVKDLTLCEIHRGQVQREIGGKIDAKFEDSTFVCTSMSKYDAIPALSNLKVVLVQRVITHSRC